jgi:hypothetical protein
VKASRAYLAGLGTSGVLIASFLLLLMVGSAIVAFRGAPGEASNDGLDRLDVSDDGEAADAIGAGRPDGDLKASHRDDRGERGGRGGRDAGRAHRSAGAAGEVGGVDGDRAADGLSADGLSGGVSGGGEPRGSAAAAGESGSGGVNRGDDAGLPPEPPESGATPRAPTPGDVANGVGGTVERTTGGLGETVGGVAPPLEAPVERTGEAVSGVVEQTAPVLDSTVNGVTGAVGGVTERVGGATGGLVDSPP